MVLAPSNCCTENIGISAIVVAELKLRDVQRQIFGADSGRDRFPALQICPEEDRANHEESQI